MNGKKSSKPRVQKTPKEFFIMKIRRFFKEVFMIYSADEFWDIEVQKRIMRHQLFFALFQNLPIFMIQLTETLQHGSTVGFFLWFSIVFSILMYLNNVAAFIPWIFEFVNDKLD